MSYCDRLIIRRDGLKDKKFLKICLSIKIDIIKITENMKLTRAEEQIMQILWKIGSGTVHDVLQNFDDDKPARTTVATVLSVLEKKGYVEHESGGRNNIYRPLIAREQYSKKQLKSFVRDYFNGSASVCSRFLPKMQTCPLKISTGS